MLTSKLGLEGFIGLSASNLDKQLTFHHNVKTGFMFLSCISVSLLLIFIHIESGVCYGCCVVRFYLWIDVILLGKICNHKYGMCEFIDCYKALDLIIILCIADSSKNKLPFWIILKLSIHSIIVALSARNLDIQCLWCFMYMERLAVSCWNGHSAVSCQFRQIA
jgi:hypothetical protein